MFCNFLHIKRHKNGVWHKRNSLISSFSFYVLEISKWKVEIILIHFLWSLFFLWLSVDLISKLRNKIVRRKRNKCDKEMKGAAVLLMWGKRRYIWLNELGLLLGLVCTNPLHLLGKALKINS
jgi:hypothetical protein